MQKAKELVRELLDKLEDDVSFEEIQYHIYVRQTIEKGLDQADRGETISQEEIEKRMSKWIGR